MTKHLMTMQIPFGGFYCSIWDDLIDESINKFVSYVLKQRGCPASKQQLEELTDSLYERVDLCLDYEKMFKQVARTYVNLFNEWATEEFEDAFRHYNLKLEYQYLNRPKFYNFETDTIGVTIPFNVVEELFELSREEDNHKTLEKVIKERHKSYDGFSSNYSTDPLEWLRKPLKDWDEIELQTLLLTCLEIQGSPWSSTNFDEQVFEQDKEFWQEEMDCILEEAIDLEKFYKDLLVDD